MVGGALSRLQDDTVHLVYGLLEPPPQSLEAAHTSGLRTGLQRVQLLKPQAPRPALPPDTNAREIRMPDVVVPPETTYWCHMTELPEGFSRHHIVMVRGGPAPGGCPWAWFSPRPGRPVLQPRVRADLVAPLTAPLPGLWAPASRPGRRASSPCTDQQLPSELDHPKPRPAGGAVASPSPRPGAVALVPALARCGTHTALGVGFPVPRRGLDAQRGRTSARRHPAGSARPASQPPWSPGSGPASGGHCRPPSRQH